MMGYYGSTPKHPEIEVGSEFVVVRSQSRTTTARILLDETSEDGVRSLVLDRLLDRYARTYVEKLEGLETRKWSASGAFTTELRFGAPTESAETLERVRLRLHAAVGDPQLYECGQTAVTWRSAGLE